MLGPTSARGNRAMVGPIGRHFPTACPTRPCFPTSSCMCATPCSTPGRATNIDGRNDPSIFPTAPIYHYLSPNIKVDAPTPAGYQTPTTAFDFFTFVHLLQDGSGGVATNVPPP